MLENLLAPWRAKYRFALAQAICYAITGVALLVAVAFGIAALYAWLATLYGAIPACLIIAGGFIVIAIIPLIVLMGLRRREQLRIAQAAERARATQWLNPGTLSLALEAARMVGRNRGLAAGAIGALLLGWMVSQFAGGSSTGDETDPTDPPTA